MGRFKHGSSCAVKVGRHKFQAMPTSLVLGHAVHADSP